MKESLTESKIATGGGAWMRKAESLALSSKKQSGREKKLLLALLGEAAEHFEGFIADVVLNAFGVKAGGFRADA